jgi:hypothetical protein
LKNVSLKTVPNLQELSFQEKHILIKQRLEAIRNSG